MKKKILAIVVLAMFSVTSMAFAGGGKNRGSEGQGSTGSNGGGSTTQTRGK